MTFFTALTRILVSGAAISFFVAFLLNVVAGVALTRSVFAMVWVLATVGAVLLVLRPGLTATKGSRGASRPDSEGSSTTKPKPTPD